MKHVTAFADRGLVKVKKTRREDGRQGANIFTVDYDALVAIQSESDDKSQSEPDDISETQSESDDTSRVNLTTRQSEASDTPSTLSHPQYLPEDPPCVPPAEKSKPDKATRLPDDWTLPDDLRTWTATELGWTDDRIRDTAERFRDYWIAAPGAKARKLDWAATWRNWCRRDNDDRPDAGGRGRQAGRIADAHARAQHELETMPDDDPRRWV